MKVSISFAALAILCSIAYFEQASSSPAPELRNFWEDFDVKLKSIIEFGKRIHKDPKGEWRSFLEKCVSKDILEAAAEGAKRNSEEGTVSIATGAVRKAVAKCARKLEVYVKQKNGPQGNPATEAPTSNEEEKKDESEAENA